MEPATCARPGSTSSSTSNVCIDEEGLRAHEGLHPSVALEKVIGNWNRAAKSNTALQTSPLVPTPGASAAFLTEWRRYPHIEAWKEAIDKIAGFDAETISMLGLSSLSSSLRRPAKEPDGDCKLLKAGAGEYDRRSPTKPPEPEPDTNELTERWPDGRLKKAGDPNWIYQEQYDRGECDEYGTTII